MFLNKNHNPWQCLLQTTPLRCEGRIKSEYTAKVMKCNKHTHPKSKLCSRAATQIFLSTLSQYFIFPSKVTARWDSRFLAEQFRVQIPAQARDFPFSKTFRPAIQPTQHHIQRIPGFSAKDTRVLSKGY